MPRALTPGATLRRIVGKGGVRVDGRQFIATELVALVGERVGVILTDSVHEIIVCHEGRNVCTAVAAGNLPTETVKAIAAAARRRQPARGGAA